MATCSGARVILQPFVSDASVASTGRQNSTTTSAGLRQVYFAPRVIPSRSSKRYAGRLTVTAESTESGASTGGEVRQVLVASVSSTAAPTNNNNAIGYAAAAVGIGLAGAALWNVLSKPESATKSSEKVIVPAPPPAPAVTNADNGATLKAAAPQVINAPAFPGGVRQAAPAAVEAIKAAFPTAQIQEDFIHAVKEELFQQGFNRDNCIALVNTCRDEVCRPIVNLIDEEFGHSFNVAGLGGLVNCGKTGFMAGMSHSPEHPCDVDGSMRERYIFFAFPHVSIGETGQEGSLLRRGRGKASSACGALIAIRGEAATARDESKEPYPSDDFEYVSLRRKVLSKKRCQQTGPDGLSLVEVTKAALEVINEDLESLIAKVVDPANADYAVITGVQIHSGWQLPGEPFRLDRTVDYIAPDNVYAVIRGEKRELTCAPRSRLTYA